MKADLEDRFRPNLPHVTSERFDDEVVIVDFATGRYHSLQGTAVGIWALVEDGARADDILRDVKGRYEANPTSIEDGVLRFLGQLLGEGLIVRVADAMESPRGQPPAPAEPGARAQFSPPVLTTFSDMEDLLVLDPIHEVDDAGWPTPRARGDS